MVKEIKKNNRKYYTCEECTFAYNDKYTAKQCEDYCRKHKSCNLEVTKYAVKDMK